MRLYNNLKRSEEKLTGLFIGGDGSGSGVRSCASMAATGQTMMPRHHHPSLPSLVRAMAIAMVVAEEAHADD